MLALALCMFDRQAQLRVIIRASVTKQAIVVVDDQEAGCHMPSGTTWVKTIVSPVLVADGGVDVSPHGIVTSRLIGR